QSEDELEEEDEKAMSTKFVDNLVPTTETLTATLPESFVLSAGVDETKARLGDFVPREDECLTSDS
nr:hypothetical protein [Tanacetum cinerariifolium]